MAEIVLLYCATLVTFFVSALIIALCVAGLINLTRYIFNKLFARDEQ